MAWGEGGKRECKSYKLPETRELKLLSNGDIQNAESLLTSIILV